MRTNAETIPGLDSAGRVIGAQAMRQWREHTIPSPSGQRDGWRRATSRCSLAERPPQPGATLGQGCSRNSSASSPLTDASSISIPALPLPSHCHWPATAVTLELPATATPL